MGVVQDRKPSNVANDEIDLIELFSSLWKQRFLISAIVVICLASGIFYLQRATYLYKAEVKVAPAQSTQTNSKSKLGGLASLASIAGISMSQDPGTMYFLLYTEGVHSRSVAEALAREPDVMKVIFRNEWDAETQRFVEPRPGIVGSAVKGIKSLLGVRSYPWKKPGADRLQDYIQKNVKVTEDATSPIVTLSFEHEDPRFAARFLMEIHAVLDDGIRQKARQRATQYIDYLSKQLQSATLFEHRTALSQALGEQERSRMMASSTLAFAAEPLDPATTSLRPTRPQPALVLLLSVVIGLALSLGVALMRLQFSKQQWHSHPPEPQSGKSEASPSGDM